MSDQHGGLSLEQSVAAPRCSVIVPSYRSAATIAACLRSLEAQCGAPSFEVVVVDSSPDETPALVRREFPWVRLIQLPRQTDPAAARNLGAGQARGEVLAFIDSDCVAAPDWLRRLHAHLASGYHAAGGAIANANRETTASWAGYLCEFREFLPEAPARDADNLTLGNAAYLRASFWACGGFPLGCYPQEDQLFHARLRAAGGRIRLDPGIVVAHTHRAKVGAFLGHQRRIGRANARVLRGLAAPGAALARRPLLATLAAPALVPLRFARTLWACRRVERNLLLRWPALLGLCWLGMCCWGLGFVEGAWSAASLPNRSLSEA